MEAGDRVVVTLRGPLAGQAGAVESVVSPGVFIVRLDIGHRWRCLLVDLQGAEDYETELRVRRSRAHGVRRQEYLAKVKRYKNGGVAQQEEAGS